VRPSLPSWLTAFAVQTDLPADWAVDRDQVPKAPAPLHIDVPLGQMANPFKQELARQALDLYRDGRFVDATERAEAAWKALGDKPNPERTLFAFLIAQLRMAAGDKSGAIAAARVAVTHPSLGPAALRFLSNRADEQGLSAVVLALSKDRDDPTLLLLRARALRRNGQTTEAQAVLDRLQVPKGTGLFLKATVERMRLLHARGKEDEAVAIARDLLEHTKSAQAEEAVDFLSGSSDGVWQQRLAQRPADGPAVLEALVYAAQRRRYARAIPAFESLAEDKHASQAVRCHARSWAARAHDRKAELDKSPPIYDQLAKGCDGQDVRDLQIDEDPLVPGQVAYRHGRALLLLGKADGITLVKRALDAGLKGADEGDARTLLMLAKSPDALALFKQHGTPAAQDYAERDIVDVVAWRFAMERMVAGKWKEALPILDRQVALRDQDAPGPDARFDDRDWARGRADYFAGRALQVLGKSNEAETRWRRVVQRHPLAYYATMAQAQLQAAGAQPADLAATSSEPCGPQVDDKVLADQGLQRARLLGQLGWHDEAADELDVLGLGRDVATEQRWTAGDPGGAWTRSALDAEAGRWVSSHSTGRDLLRKYATSYPTDANREAWQLAYPRAFRALIESAAKEFKLHPSVVWAICRSESGFNPRVESHAAAIGLLQLILPTAQAMAKPLGLTADAQTLRQPAVNVRLGARYLKALLDRFDREAQMAAGYNAGGGAVGRWRKQRGEWPMDLFVEAIPFRETRDYAKRVLSTIAVYRNLYEGETLHAFGLSQKPVPVQDEAPTEPPSTAQSRAASQIKGASKPAAPVQIAQVESKAPSRHHKVAHPQVHAHKTPVKTAHVHATPSQRRTRIAVSDVKPARHRRAR
jgi:soluble lytic murein transglycosylase-like protein